MPRLRINSRANVVALLHIRHPVNTIREALLSPELSRLPVYALANRRPAIVACSCSHCICRIEQALATQWTEWQ